MNDLERNNNIMLLHSHFIREWSDDSQTTECNRCHTKFTYIIRRHHCRHCGLIFCRKCTKYRIPSALIYESRNELLQHNQRQNSVENNPSDEKQSKETNVKRKYLKHLQLFTKHKSQKQCRSAEQERNGKTLSAKPEELTFLDPITNEENIMILDDEINNYPVPTIVYSRSENNTMLTSTDTDAPLSAGKNEIMHNKINIAKKRFSLPSFKLTTGSAEIDQVEFTSVSKNEDKFPNPRSIFAKFAHLNKSQYDNREERVCIQCLEILKKKYFVQRDSLDANETIIKETTNNTQQNKLSDEKKAEDSVVRGTQHASATSRSPPFVLVKRYILVSILAFSFMRYLSFCYPSAMYWILVSVILSLVAKLSIMFSRDEKSQYKSQNNIVTISLEKEGARHGLIKYQSNHKIIEVAKYPVNLSYECDKLTSECGLLFRDNTGWNVYEPHPPCEKSHYRILSKFHKSSKVLRCSITLPITMNQAFGIVYGTSIEPSLSFIPRKFISSHSYQSIKKIDQFTDIVYGITSFDENTNLMNDRDYVLLRTWTRNTNEKNQKEKIVCFKSVDVSPVEETCTKKTPIKKKRRIRGFVRFEGFLLQEMDCGKSTKITWILNADFKGWMPKMMNETVLYQTMNRSLCELNQIMP